MFQKIAPHRLLFYIMILPLLPIFCYLPFYYLGEMKELKELEQQIETLQQALYIKGQRQSVNNTVREQYSVANAAYLEETFSKLTLLDKEKNAIEKILKTLTFPGNEALESRYTYLSGGTNRISFLEGSSVNKEGVVETLFTLDHPIEIDTTDLKTILEKVEGENSNAPQLFFTEFKINKIRKPNLGEDYELNMQILKREYLP